MARGIRGFLAKADRCAVIDAALVHGRMRKKIGNPRADFFAAFAEKAQAGSTLTQ
jgi:hypothetical protein